MSVTDDDPQPERDDAGDANAKHALASITAIEHAAATVIERAAPVAGVGLATASIFAAAAEGAASILAPVLGTIVASAIPAAVEAVRRINADRSGRTKRAHAAARRAWINEAAMHGRSVSL
ncbi:MAG: hypothetical protein QOE53_3081 [Pseudonocardiales bacterium]|jgi:hypothetical protein|nr:hypothetical protein [Pseudonocardiales bacterium]